MTSFNEQTQTSVTLAELGLDPSLYNPRPGEVKFFKEQTGIQDDSELRKHIISVQEEAWKVNNQCLH